MVDFWNGEIKHIAPINLMSAEAEAVSYAVREAMQKYQVYARALPLYATIEKVPEEALDLMALEMDTQYYDQTFSRKQKERLVTQTLAWYMHAGTPSILSEFLETILAGGYIEEWHDYNGKPYHFKAYAYAEGHEVPLGYGKEVERQLKRYKNVRSWLEYFMFIIALGYRVNIAYKSSVQMTTRFYPRGNIAYQRLDGTWKLDGRRKLSLYRKTMNFYPSAVSLGACFRTHVQSKGQNYLIGKARQKIKIRAGAESASSSPVKIHNQKRLVFSTRTKASVTSGNIIITVINKLDGTWKLDGNRRLNGGPYLQ